MKRIKDKDKDKKSKPTPKPEETEKSVDPGEMQELTYKVDSTWGKI